jgi:CPA2 family monovalent cation:H+ antiporter-2
VLGEVLLELALLFALCVGVAITFHRLRLPPVVAFLATGAVVGPRSLGLVHREDVVRELAELGIVILLFTVGLEVSVAQLVRLRRAVIVGGSLQIIGTVLVGAGAAMALGLPWNQAVFLGLLLSLSSTAVVSKVLGDHGEFNAPHGRISLGICLAQDLAVVPMILSVPLLAAAAGEGGTPVLWGMAKSLGILLVATLGIRWLLPRVLDLVARTRSRELFVLTVATLCLSMATITQQLGMSLALGAFLAGVLLADSDYHHQAVAEMGPFRDALSALFFVSIGMLFDPGVIAAAPGIAMVALLAVLVGKGVVVMGVAKWLGLPFWFRLRTALTLAQVGEFSFLLVQVGANLLPPQLEKVFLVVSVLSIAATPVLYGLGLVLVRRARAAPDQGREPAAGKTVRDHAVIVGFGPTGQAVGRALQASGIPFVAVEMNAATVRAFRDRGFRILLGDCTRDVVLRAAAVEAARVMIVAINDADAASRTFRVARRLAPKLHVIARATYLAEVPLLRKTGASEVVAQELETSVEIMVRVLRRYLVPEDEIARQVKLAREAEGGGEKLAGVAPADVARIAEFVPGLAMQFFRVAADAEACGRSLLDAGIRRRTGCAVVAVRRGAENLPVITPETVLQADDVAVVIGPEARMADAAAMFHAVAVPARGDGKAAP